MIYDIWFRRPNRNEFRRRNRNEFRPGWSEPRNKWCNVHNDLWYQTIYDQRATVEKLIFQQLFTDNLYLRGSASDSLWCSRWVPVSDPNVIGERLRQYANEILASPDSPLMSSGFHGGRRFPSGGFQHSSTSLRVCRTRRRDGFQVPLPRGQLSVVLVGPRLSGRGASDFGPSLRYNTSLSVRLSTTSRLSTFYLFHHIVYEL